MTYTVTSFGKAHVINKNIDGFYAKTTQEDSARFVLKLKKNVKPTYSIFQHVSIMYVSFFRLNRILSELHRRFLYVSFFSGEKAR